jgi:hypothetical protein
MKIYIDLSLFYGSTGAFGRVSGELDLPAVPQVGNTIVCSFPNNGVLPVVVGGFDGLLTVTDVRFAAQALNAPISLSLDDVVLQTREDARKVMTYLEEGFGLFGEEYEVE